MLISINFQSEEVKPAYNYHSWISERFRLLYYFFSLFFDPLSRGVFHLIYPLLNHLHPPLVDHSNSYLSTCPIRYPLQLSVSCGSQGGTVQRSSPHKCGQKSSYNAFNAMVSAFPYIFLGFLPSHMFMRHIPVIEASWKVTLIARLHTLNHIHQVQGGCTPRTTFHLLSTYGT